MHIGGILGGLCTAMIVATISTHLFLSPDPEVTVLASEGGGMRVVGRSYDADKLTLTQGSDLLSVPLSGHAYTIAPEEYVFADGISLIFATSLERPVLYRMQAQEGYWKPVSNVLFQENGEARAVIDRAGTYALGEEVSVELPLFVDALDALREKIPAHVVAYRVDVLGYIEENTPILLEAGVERGGCGGIPTAGESRTVTWEQRTAEVMVNDVQTPVTLIFSLAMEATAGGCAENAPLAPIF